MSVPIFQVCCNSDTHVRCRSGTTSCMIEASHPARLCRWRSTNIKPADSRYDRGTSGNAKRGDRLVDPGIGHVKRDKIVVILRHPHPATAKTRRERPQKQRERQTFRTGPNPTPIEPPLWPARATPSSLPSDLPESTSCACTGLKSPPASLWIANGGTSPLDSMWRKRHDRFFGVPSPRSGSASHLRGVICVSTSARRSPLVSATRTASRLKSSECFIISLVS